MVAGCDRSIIYVRDYKVDSPRFQQPYLFTPDSIDFDARISFSASSLPRSQLKGYTHKPVLLDINGIFQVDTVITDEGIAYFELPGNGHPYKGTNLAWNFQNYSLSAFIDRPVSQRFGYWFGLNHSKVGQEQYNIFSFGLGYWIPTKYVAGRIDFSIQFINRNYTSHFIQLVTHPKARTDVAFFEFSDSQTSCDWQSSLTINTNSRESTTNLFLQISGAGQTLSSFEEEAPLRAARSYVYVRHFAYIQTLTVTPGAIVSLGSFGNLALGVQFINHYGLDIYGQSKLVSPLIQYSMPIQ